MPSPLARFLLGRPARRAAVTSRRRAPALQVDALESRLAPANLRNPAIQLEDANNPPMAILVNGTSTFTTVTGGMVRVRASWLTDDLSDSDKYTVKANLNGFDLTAVDVKG